MDIREEDSEIRKLFLKLISIEGKNKREKQRSSLNRAKKVGLFFQRHDWKFIRCEVCLEHFYHRRLLLYHQMISCYQGQDILLRILPVKLNDILVGMGCPVCGDIRPDRKSVFDHLKNCIENFKQNFNLECKSVHINNQNKKDHHLLSCWECRKGFLTLKEFQEHLRVCVDPDTKRLLNLHQNTAIVNFTFPSFLQISPKVSAIFKEEQKLILGDIMNSMSVRKMANKTEKSDIIDDDDFDHHDEAGDPFVKLNKLLQGEHGELIKRLMLGHEVEKKFLKCDNCRFEFPSISAFCFHKAKDCQGTGGNKLPLNVLTLKDKGLVIGFSCPLCGFSRPEKKEISSHLQFCFFTLIRNEVECWAKLKCSKTCDGDSCKVKGTEMSCLTCKQKVSNIHELRVHSIRVHRLLIVEPLVIPKPRMGCRLCHSNLCSSTISAKCQLCPKRCGSVHSMTMHRLVYHNLKSSAMGVSKIVCNLCNKSNCTEYHRWQCNECHFVVQNKHQENEHVQKFHSKIVSDGKKSVSCSVCPFPNCKTVCKGECKMCSKTFQTHHDLYQDLNLHFSQGRICSPDENLKMSFDFCAMCGSNLPCQIQSNMVCRSCKKSYLTKHDFFIHFRSVHFPTVSNDFEKMIPRSFCYLCGYEVESEQNFWLHMKFIHGKQVTEKNTTCKKRKEMNSDDSSNDEKEKAETNFKEELPSWKIKFKNTDTPARLKNLVKRKPTSIKEAKPRNSNGRKRMRNFSDEDIDSTTTTESSNDSEVEENFVKKRLERPKRNVKRRKKTLKLSSRDETSNGELSSPLRVENSSPSCDENSLPSRDEISSPSPDEKTNNPHSNQEELQQELGTPNVKELKLISSPKKKEQKILEDSEFIDDIPISSGDEFEQATPIENAENPLFDGEVEEGEPQFIPRINTKEENEEFTCNYCDQTFAIEASCKLHIERHERLASKKSEEEPSSKQQKEPENEEEPSSKQQKETENEPPKVRVIDVEEEEKNKKDLPEYLQIFFVEPDTPTKQDQNGLSEDAMTPPLKKVASPSNLVVSPSNLVVSPANYVASPSNLVVSSTNSVVSPSNVVVSPSRTYFLDNLPITATVVSLSNLNDFSGKSSSQITAMQYLPGQIKTTNYSAIPPTTAITVSSRCDIFNPPSTSLGISNVIQPTPISANVTRSANSSIQILPKAPSSTYSLRSNQSVRTIPRKLNNKPRILSKSNLRSSGLIITPAVSKQANNFISSPSKLQKTKLHSGSGSVNQATLAKPFHPNKTTITRNSNDFMTFMRKFLSPEKKKQLESQAQVESNSQPDIVLSTITSQTSVKMSHQLSDCHTIVSTNPSATIQTPTNRGQRSDPINYPPLDPRAGPSGLSNSNSSSAKRKIGSSTYFYNPNWDSKSRNKRVLSCSFCNDFEFPQRQDLTDHMRRKHFNLFQ